MNNNSSLISRRRFCAGASIAALSLALAACSSSSPSTSAGVESAKIRIGSMPTEDILPLWVALEQGIFDDLGLDAEIIIFDSAQNLSAGFVAGEVDIIMTDPMRAAKLFESGIDLAMDWITLGETPAEGRFGVLVSADSGYTTLADLVGCSKGIGLAANTVPEYVFEMLCKQEGVDPADIKTEEVPSLPDRYSLLAAGNLDAAALPGSMLAFGEACGLKVLADDSTGENISQSVMIGRTAFAEANNEALMLCSEAWDKAAELINADPESYRETLIAHANLNEKVADSYPISHYPASTKGGSLAYPAAELIEPQLEWMLDKGYLNEAVSYDAATGTFSK